MTKFIWDKSADKWVDIAEYRLPAVRRGANIISDNLDYMFNHADGKRYTSKRAYDRAVRQAGCEIAGNEITPGRLRPPDRRTRPGVDIRRAMEKLGYY